MNYIIIAGHLGSDPETRFTPSGQKVINFRIAVNIRKGGKEETVWYRVTIWGERFDKMVSYLKKGSAVIVSGELGKPEIYTDREGKQQVSLDITADNIRFSPFGRGDKTERQDQTGSQNQTSYGTAYGESSYSSNANQAYAGSNFAPGNFGAQSNYGTEDSEDALPF